MTATRDALKKSSVAVMTIVQRPAAWRLARAEILVAESAVLVSWHHSGVNESERAERQRAIAEYAAAMAGTEFDLDPGIEAAGIENLLKPEPKAG